MYRHRRARLFAKSHARAPCTPTVIILAAIYRPRDIARLRRELDEVNADLRGRTRFPLYRDFARRRMENFIGYFLYFDGVDLSNRIFSRLNIRQIYTFSVFCRVSRRTS